MENKGIVRYSFRDILSALLEKESSEDFAFQIMGDESCLFHEVNFSRFKDTAITTDCLAAAQLLEGSGTFVLNEIKYKVKAPAVFIVLPGFSFRLASGSEKLDMRIAVMSKAFLDDLYEMSLRLGEIRANLILNPVLQLDERSAGDVDLYTKAMSSIASRPDNADMMTCAKYLTISFLYGSLFQNIKSTEAEESSRLSFISGKFHKLLAEHYREEHKIGFYASALCISEKYLYLAVKNVTGQTPSHWIDTYLVSEAKNLLAHTDMSMFQISEALHFASQSHFGKFFKNLTGMTPLSFRNQR